MASKLPPSDGFTHLAHVLRKRKLTVVQKAKEEEEEEETEEDDENENENKKRPRRRRRLIDPAKKFGSRKQAREKFPDAAIRANFNYTTKKMEFYPDPTGKRITRHPRVKEYLQVRADLVDGIRRVACALSDDICKALREVRDQKMTVTFSHVPVKLVATVFLSEEAQQRENPGVASYVATKEEIESLVSSSSVKLEQDARQMLATEQAPAAQTS